MGLAVTRRAHGPSGATNSLPSFFVMPPVARRARVVWQMTRRSGLMFGYRGMGVDTGEVGSASQLPPGSGEPAINFHMTHYGPIVAMNLRWGVK